MTYHAFRQRGAYGNRIPGGIDQKVVKPWWLYGNIPVASCVSAYQPKGVADKVHSWTNIANPGTNDASEGNGIIGWSCALGWHVDSGEDRIDTGIVIPYSANSLAYSVIGRVITLSPGHGTPYGRVFEAGSSGNFLSIPYVFDAIAGSRSYNNGGGIYSGALGGGDGNLNGTIGFAKNKAYLNGSFVADIPNGIVSGGNLYLGNRGDNARAMDGYILAFAIYNFELTATQFYGLHTAMMAL